jgi:peptide chain release factor subunit 1
MLSHEELTRLAALNSEQGVLSAYIKVDPQLMYDRSHPLAQFKGAVKRFTRRANDARRLATLEREKEKVLRFLEGWEPGGRGLVIFSSQPDEIWEVLSLGVPVPSFVDADTTTNTAILARLLDEFPRFVVALVQRDRARIYVAEQRTVREEAGIASDVPGRHDQGGWAQARFQRHIEFHVLEHLRRVADELEQLYHYRPFNRLAVGGTEEAVNELLKTLPQQLSRRVIGTFAVDFKHETEEAMLERARQVREEDERRSERELVERVVDAAKSGGHGVLGIEETVRAVRDGRVHTLLVAEGVTKEGAACLSCDYFATKEFRRCPVCGGAAEPAYDIVDRAVERAYLAGAHLEIVFGEARRWLLAQGGLAAVLRY